MAKIYQGIDLSKHNRVDSWELVKKKNKVEFCILRAGGNYGGMYKDSKFEKYYDACKNYGIPVGAYYDAGKEFIGTDAGIEDAEHFLKLLSGKQLEYPVALDIEVTPAKYRTSITNAAIAFCNVMESHGYYVSIYGADISTFAEELDIRYLTKFDKWVARIPHRPSYVKDYGIWQYSHSGSINGIFGNVDLDYSYKNYPKIIKGAHLNGY